MTQTFRDMTDLSRFMTQTLPKTAFKLACLGLNDIERRLNLNDRDPYKLIRKQRSAESGVNPFPCWYAGAHTLTTSSCSQ